MSEQELDPEWVELIVEARNKGMTKEDILLFLTSYKEQETNE
ncbi:DNA-binding anti-repressor SinI [Peribacillus asahii]|uniref:DNA-binding anti-repressor SinI n=1 Tax=Peribacillus asahii TaxID=228899 RepID=A0A398B5T4_9BACI|nr:anti-repressor SinI family protein [Peribacillus asahii]RID84804.1 DNA-binding anti-repressor SinI [Peribacillus asahii]